MKKTRTLDVPNMMIRNWVAKRLERLIREKYGFLDWKSVSGNIEEGNVSSSYLRRFVKKRENALSIDRLDYIVRAIGHPTVKTLGDFFAPMESSIDVQAEHRQAMRTINALLQTQPEA